MIRLAGSGTGAVHRQLQRLENAGLGRWTMKLGRPATRLRRWTMPLDRKHDFRDQQTRVSLNAPPQVGLPQETFAVANAADLKSQLTTTAGPVLFATQAEAYQQQQELIAQNPVPAGQLQVVSHSELNVN